MIQRRIVAVAAAAAIALASVLVRSYEGVRYSAYQDVTGVWTICEGHTRGVRQGDRATKEQCDAYREEDLDRADASIRSCLTGDVTINQRAAFIDFEYNTGKFCGSSLMRKANAGDQRGACDALGLYMYAGGKDCRIAASNCYGIVRRRASQHALCWPDFGNVLSGSRTAP